MPSLFANYKFWLKKEIRVMPGVFLCAFFVLGPNFAYAEPVTINSSELINLTNQERKILNLNTLTENQQLKQAAADKAQDMIDKDYFAHTSPEGISPWFWFDKNDYNYVYAGENLALGFDDSNSAHAAWMASPGHKANIINCHYTEIGIAALTGEYEGQTVTVAVQMFGSLKDTDCKPIKPEPEQPQTQTTSSSLPDTTPPDTPQFTTNLSTTTNNSRPTLEGISEPNVDVGLYLDNGQQLGFIGTNHQGNFTFTFKNDLPDGNYLIKSQAFDKAGNASKFSRTLSISIDTQPPQIDTAKSFVKPNPDNELEEFVVQVRMVDNDTKQITALTSNLNVPLSLSGMTWQGKVPQGSDKIRVIARDKAGNSSIEEIDFFVASSNNHQENQTTISSLQKINNLSRNLTTIFLLITLIIMLARLGFQRFADEPDEIII